MNGCLSDLRIWLLSDRLTMNDDKTASLLIGTTGQLGKINDTSNVYVGDYDEISPRPCVRDLGEWFDKLSCQCGHK